MTLLKKFSPVVLTAAMGIAVMVVIANSAAASASGLSVSSDYYWLQPYNDANCSIVGPIDSRFVYMVRLGDCIEQQMQLTNASDGNGLVLSIWTKVLGCYTPPDTVMIIQRGDCVPNPIKPAIRVINILALQ